MEAKSLTKRLRRLQEPEEDARGVQRIPVNERLAIPIARDLQDVSEI
jgi:hypothetical protein